MGRVEVYPKLDGRNMTMVLAPDKRAQAARAARQARAGSAQSANGAHRPLPRIEASSAPDPAAPQPPAEPEVALDRRTR